MADAKISFPQLLEDNLNQLSSAELQIARALIDSSFLAGMENASRLAERAGVSNPTVARFAERLGYKNYSEMRRTIIDHYDARLKGLDDLAREQSTDEIGGIGALYHDLVNDCLKSNDVDAMDSVSKLIAKSTVPVISTGGVYSTV
jgi:DNA-binding MurR/RpiR family transcriptional regulator